MSGPPSVRSRHRTSLGGTALDDARRRLIYPLDYADLDEARIAASRIAPSIGAIKIGLELFLRHGPGSARLGQELGLDVFLDLKLHDIPETVGRAVAAAAALRVRYLTVHAGGGFAMLQRAAQEAARAEGMILLAVTVLTSLDDQDLAAQGVSGGAGLQARRLADLAWSAGVRGFVASPAEVPLLRAALGPTALIVTPGIRPSPEGSPAASAPLAGDDQKRIATPSAAIAAGADLLVVGRPIRDAADPPAAARAVVNEIARALKPT